MDITGPGGGDRRPIYSTKAQGKPQQRGQQRGQQQSKHAKHAKGSSSSSSSSSAGARRLKRKALLSMFRKWATVGVPAELLLMTDKNTSGGGKERHVPPLLSFSQPKKVPF
jgi:hypothetical protein